MSEISLGQFIKNAFNYSLGKPMNQPPAAQSNENFNQIQQANIKIVNETVQNLQRNIMQHADIMNTQMQLKQLNDLERSMMLKDLFNFPKDMKALMEMLVKTGTMQALTANDLKSLFSQNLDLSKLMHLLQTNGKNAEEKLSKMIATLNRSGIYETRQLKEMTTLINACIPMPDTSSAAMIKTLLLMYLPWLPLAENTGFNIGYEEDENKKGSDSENIITIMITTRSFGLVKVLIYLEKSDLNIEINCSEEFPKKEFNESIKSESTGYSLNTDVSYTVRKTAKEEEAKKPETNINITKSAKISPHLLLAIHTIINLVLELDKRAGLVEDRSKR